MRVPRIDIGSIRREQIVEAAVGIIHEQGIQNLSLSEIEKKAGMSRGQLTYYFPAKEDILLAVFDRVVQRIHEHVEQTAGQGGSKPTGWETTRHLLEMLLIKPLMNREFGSLQYTFLAQMTHREDYRQRLAKLYATWQDGLAQGLAEEFERHPPVREVSPRQVASVVQALLHGMVMQRVTHPERFDGEAMVELCLDMMASYIWGRPRARHARSAGMQGESQAARLIEPPAISEVKR